MATQKFLITGSMGCIGSWVIRRLIDQGVDLVATDLSTEPVRAKLLLSDEEISAVNWVPLDVTNKAAVNAAVADHGITNIIHLAGLQIPFCRADPALGAAVNVTGTINILEAARINNIQGLCYASSLAAMGPAALYPERPVRDDVPLMPATLYGVYKAANEGTARVYWQDCQLGSVGLRPYVVYGVARDQGMTSDLARAVLAIAAGRPFHIRFDGPVAMQHAGDVAQIFIDSARVGYQGAAACNLRGDVIEVSEFVDLLLQLYPDAEITFERNAPLPFPADLDDSGLRSILSDVPHTPLREAVQTDIKRFKTLLAAGKINLDQLNN